MKWNLGLNFNSSEVFLFNPLDAKKEEFKRFIKKKEYHIYLILLLDFKSIHSFRLNNSINPLIYK